ncbi:septal ring lytic transglycosylase RlpA family protein [Actimicrobium sp. CCI2.3]|uniref:septal ring lytic transglycosylase RlpA family protein n=1 Tax=Actimicrobium sp. CCI2.3 TaxID=3048616 RepID=UPI002AB41F31|nr:septal ring lytic transglycosylase RlpA family protein [Actimicrobium sp. CCI2.3]MDY7576462.1 septal ring lytic transglycosylase RlpA family protein [Actimicrobium sp. CCI2.3]MEB0021560.1 septal ring lytic transglycosylase RlpA family protein [Actimicrobium sp. CCI2.3]
MQDQLRFPILGRLLAGVAALLLAACGSVPLAPPAAPAAPTANSDATAPKVKRAPAMPAAGSGRGGYYLDDGPGDNPPDNLLAIPDAEPKIEANFARNNRPYVVFGENYTPMPVDAPFKQRGIASWYGKKFHGQKTSSGELYDMYKMTGAHPTLPLPSYVRVTNLSNGRKIIVRINDRGPFHSSRIMDLSYTAALKLGYLGHGSSEIEIERLMPDEIARMEKDRLGERALSLDEPVAARAPVQVLAALDVKSMPVRTFVAGPASDEGAVIPPAMTSGSALTIDMPAPRPSETIVPLALPAPAASSASAPVSSAGYYLQLGAYSQAPNAEAARVRIQRTAPDTSSSTEVVQTGAVYRLYSGPFSSRADAATAAQKIQDAGGAKPFIVQR